MTYQGLLEKFCSLRGVNEGIIEPNVKTAMDVDLLLWATQMLIEKLRETDAVAAAVTTANQQIITAMKAMKASTLGKKHD